MCEVEDRMPVTELALWYASYEADPWGQERDDVSRALCAVAVSNHMAQSKVTVKDLMPQYGVTEAKSTEVNRVEQEALRERVEAWAGSVGIRVYRGDSGTKLVR